jgi:hypothetical protein
MAGRKEPQFLTVTLLLCGVAVAALCGRTLDARYQTIVGAASPGSSEDSQPTMGEDPRAALRRSAESASAPTDSEDRGRRLVLSMLQRVSGVGGDQPLSPKNWRSERPVWLEGVDVAGLLSREVVLARSLASGYRPSSVEIGGTFARPGVFLDLAVKDVRGASLIFTIQGGEVSASYRSSAPHSETLPEVVRNRPGAFESQLVIEQGRATLPTPASCSTLAFAYGDDGYEVRCASAPAEQPTLLRVPLLPFVPKTVSVTTNLTADELSRVVVRGAQGGVLVEDVG